MSYPQRVEVCNSTELDKWIKERHYLNSVPAGARLRLWVIDNKGERIGAMMWGRPSARALNQEKLLELTRMVLSEDTEKFAESRALKLARSYIRKHFPEIKGVIAYSSTGQNHEGIIYMADNWFELGKTQARKVGWNSREGRTMRDSSIKIRWVRSP